MSFRVLASKRATVPSTREIAMCFALPAKASIAGFLVRSAAASSFAITFFVTGSKTRTFGKLSTLCWVLGDEWDFLDT